MKPEEIKKGNLKSKIGLHRKLTILNYFEEDGINIQLFSQGNDHFREMARQDLLQIKSAEAKGAHVQLAWRTNDLSLENVYEADMNLLISLFKIKFSKAKKTNKFKTAKIFAMWEYEEVTSRYQNDFDWFPILKQWTRFLKEVSDERIVVEEKIEKQEEFNLARMQIEEFLHLLKEVEPPVIDCNSTYILGERKKSSLAAFVKVLKEKGKLNINFNDQLLSKVLNSLIPGLFLGTDGKTLRNNKKTASIYYYPRFKYNLEN